MPCALSQLEHGILFPVKLSPGKSDIHGTCKLTGRVPMKRRGWAIAVVTVGALLVLDAAVLFLAQRGAFALVYALGALGLFLALGANCVPYLMLRRHGIRITPPWSQGRIDLTKALEALERRGLGEEVREAQTFAKVAKCLFLLQTLVLCAGTILSGHARHMS